MCAYLLRLVSCLNTYKRLFSSYCIGDLWFVSLANGSLLYQWFPIPLQDVSLSVQRELVQAQLLLADILIDISSRHSSAVKQDMDKTKGKSCVQKVKTCLYMYIVNL